MLYFNVLEKGLGIISPPQFVYHFTRNMFLLLYSINLPNFVFLLPLLLEILNNMCIAIVCFTVCDIRNFEIKQNDQKVNTKI